MSEARVRARGLGFTHRGGRIALQDVDLEVREGEIVVVLGPNGSGKSSLLRLLATSVSVQKGELEVLGERASAAPSLRRRLGFAGDMPVHVEALTAVESIEMLGRASGLSAVDARRRGTELLARVGLANDATAPVGSFSLGMRRRLMLAETVVHDPALVLLDEPTLGLDPEGLDVLAELLRGRTVVVATNDVAFAARVAHRVVFLNKGRVVAHGEPGALLDRIGADAIVEVALSAAPRAAVAWPTGVRVELESPETLHLRAPRGGGVVPALLRALEEAGASVRAVGIREPDLSDVFRAATGEPLT